MDQNPNNPTDLALSDPAQLTGADGGAAVAETLSLAELNALLGKDFKDKATALKSVKDTYAYVGKKVDTVAPAAQVQTNPAIEAQLNSLKGEIFYANHPEYKGHEAIINAMGSDPAEVVGTAAFKTYFEKAKVADEVAKTKSVVTSNSRLAQTRSVTENAVKAADAGRSDVMIDTLAKGINEAFSPKS